MTVSAAIIADADMATGIAGIYVAPEHRCPAHLYGAKCPQLMRVQSHLFSLAAQPLQHIGYFTSLRPAKVKLLSAGYL